MSLEQAVGPVNRLGVNHPKPRSLKRLWSPKPWLTRGGDAVCYLQWLTSVSR
ncbi:hypothetical protein [Streptomyces sp. SA15]|uniref:Uncharacterized protein n=1 Tax=Streptomyces sporangiiformans TaxID=2315329 RepID=A0A505DHU8_9ACTN|nr:MULTISPECIES: hypothetical protein [Streptomyces]TPQ22560.1 hypothetical protein FGD71_009975 [Streptomyces sporangiiformans]